MLSKSMPKLMPKLKLYNKNKWKLMPDIKLRWKTKLKLTHLIRSKTCLSQHKGFKVPPNNNPVKNQSKSQTYSKNPRPTCIWTKAHNLNFKLTLVTNRKLCLMCKKPRNSRIMLRTNGASWKTSSTSTPFSVEKVTLLDPKTLKRKIRKKKTKRLMDPNQPRAKTVMI